MKKREKKNKTTKNRRLPSFWRYHNDRDIREYEDKQKSTQTIYRKKKKLTNGERESAEKKNHHKNTRF